MARSTAPLRVVDDAPAPAPADPIDEMTLLFAHEAQLARQLADTRAALERARLRYAAADGSLALPRMELLRTRLGPQPGGGGQC